MYITKKLLLNRTLQKKSLFLSDIILCKAEGSSTFSHGCWIIFATLPMTWSPNRRVVVVAAIVVAAALVIYGPYQPTMRNHDKLNAVLLQIKRGGDEIQSSTIRNTTTSDLLQTTTTPPTRNISSCSTSGNVVTDAVEHDAWPLQFPPLTALDTVTMQERLRHYLSPIFATPQANRGTWNDLDTKLHSTATWPNHTDAADVSLTSDDDAVAVEFLICVRPWLYELLAAKFPHLTNRTSKSRELDTSNNNTPLPLRGKMGELRTWTSLLDALDRVLGCYMVLSQSCEELEGWRHNITVNSTPSLSVKVLRVFLTEDLSVEWLRQVGKTEKVEASRQHLHRRQLCQQRARQTVAIAGQSSKFFDNQRILPLFHIAQHEASLGMVAECRSSTNRPDPRKQQRLRSLSATINSETDDNGYGASVNLTSGVPAGPLKKWYAVLWGKTGQVGSKVRQAVDAVRKFIPVISSCVGSNEYCDPSLPTLKIRNVSTLTGGPIDVPSTFAAAVRSAVLLIGARAPERGAACPEALACGTYIVARGRNFGFEFAGHPFVRRFRKPRDFAESVKNVLVDMWGFNESAEFDQQPQPPDRRRAWIPLLRLAHQNSRHQREENRYFGKPLPHRYTPEGYSQHIATLFHVAYPRRTPPHSGRRRRCHLARLRQDIVLDAKRNGNVVVHGKDGRPVPQGELSFLLSTFSSSWDSWRWSGCE